MSKALATVDTSKYPMLAPNSDLNIAEVMETNLGGAQVSLFNLNRVKIPAGGMQAWAIRGMEGDEIVQSFDGVIVGQQGVRTYWKTNLDSGGGGTPPDCYSPDLVHGIGDPGINCRDCPLNAWGSDVKGGRGKACKERRVLLVVREGQLLPIMLNFPPTSLKPVTTYMMDLLTAGAIPFYGVVTRFTLEKQRSQGGNDFAQVKLSMVQRLDPDETAKAYAYHQAIKELFLNQPIAATVAADVQGEASPFADDDGEVVNY